MNNNVYHEFNPQPEVKTSPARHPSTYFVLLVLLVSAFYYLFEFKSTKLQTEAVYVPGLATQTIYSKRPIYNTSFAGEKTPIERADVYRRLSREIKYNLRHRKNLECVFRRADHYFPTLEKMLVANGLHPDYKYVVLVESMFTNSVSPKGAVGYWQLMEGTGKYLGLEISPEADERLNLAKSTKAASKYFKMANKKFKSNTLSLASYNAGMGSIERAAKLQNTTDFYQMFLNAESTRYVYKLLAFKELYENREKYGIGTTKIEIAAKLNNLIWPLG